MRNRCVRLVLVMMFVRVTGCEKTGSNKLNGDGSDAPNASHNASADAFVVVPEVAKGKQESAPPVASVPTATVRELSKDAQARVIEKRAEELKLQGFDGAQLVQFLSKLRKAVVQEDRVNVARLINYPLLLVSVNGKSLTFRHSRDFLNAYETILTERVRQEIENASICNVAAISGAVAIGAGVVWVKNLNGPSIVTINVPGPDAPAEPFSPGGCQGDALIKGVGCISECL